MMIRECSNSRANRKARRVLCFFLSFCLCLGGGSFYFADEAYGASTFFDIRGHWAEGYIKDVVNKGIVNGYPDGKYKPDAPVTRAEFINMINRTLGNGATAAMYFSDVPYNAWYYDDVSRAVAAGYISGYAGDAFRPNSNITREEAAVIISRIVPTYGIKGDTKSFKDAKTVSAWATLPMQRVVGKGYLGAYEDGKLHPQDNITRAQAAKVICAIASGETIESATKTVKYSSTKLSNTIYSNGVNISADLADGDATITNCVILGTLSVYGGGTSTVTLTNSRVAKCKIDKDNSAVRLLVSGESIVGETNANEMCTIETSKLSGNVFGTGFDKININSSSDVSLKGDFTSVNIVGNDAILRFESGKLATLNIEKGGRYCEIHSETKAKITEALVNAPASFKGKGVVDKMTINTSSTVTYETKPKVWVLGSDGRSPSVSDAVLSVAFSPVYGATDVSLDSKINLVFNSILYNAEGNALNTTDILEAIEIRKKTSSGTKVEYTPVIGSTKKTITLTPKELLAEDTKYYIKILNEYIKNADGKYLSAETSYFTTGDQKSGGLAPDFYPENSATGISIIANPRITFPEAVKAYNGKTLNSEYFTSGGGIELREGSETGSLVPFTASINSSKTRVTIYPDANLKENTVYYLGVPKDKYKTQDGEIVIPASSVKWTTRAPAAVVTSTALSLTLTATPAETSISATATGSEAGTVYTVLLPSTATAPSAAQIIAGTDASNVAVTAKATAAVTANSAATLTSFTGLNSSTSYTLYGVLKTATTTSSVATKTASTNALSPSQLSALVVSGANSFSPSFSASGTSYDVKMPFGSTQATVSATGTAGSTIRFKIGAGAYSTYGGNTFTGAISGSTISSIMVESSQAGRTTTEYTLNVGVLGNTNLSSINVSDKTATISGGTVFLVPAACASTTVTITAADPNATISCAQLTGTVGGTGTLSGTINLTTTTTQLSFTLTSNQDERTYTTYSIVKSD